MTEDVFLQELVLGYCRQAGALVEPPAYGVYDVLLPDEVAARWGIQAIQTLTFDVENETGSRSTSATTTAIHYGHPLVETVVGELRQQSANGLFFINNVRLEKPGLYASIEKTLKLPNARLFAVPGAMERRRLYHLVRFNFKASLIADEKRELILPIWMNLQGGYAVRGDEIERLGILDDVNLNAHMSRATPAWIAGEALAGEVLTALLERARRSALVEMAPTLESLQKRLLHFLELDRARLNEYYDDLTKAAERRLRNADPERRPALEAKLAAVTNERQSKLLDVEQKYRLRVDLDLINLAVIVQPKLELEVEIRKRTVGIKRTVVWDPLRHLVEPLACDVCGLPGEVLYVCDAGHLVHASCLAPQCVECKRTYCQQCADQVQVCVICQRPVCVHSLVKCPQCQRITCHEHVDECHAADGAPRWIQAVDVVPASIVASAPIKSPASVKKFAPKAGKVKSHSVPAASAPTSAVGDALEVYSDPAGDQIVAYVFLKKRQLAVRTWELIESGISIHCRCEKGKECRATGYIHRPISNNDIAGQMNGFIQRLCDEYQIGAKKVRYYHVRASQPFEEQKLRLPARWKDADVLEAARQGFDHLR